MTTATIMTYDEARALLDGGKHKVGNNTYLREEVIGIGVRLHRTYVVAIRKDGNYALNSGGYRTATTKARINAFSPAAVYQEKGKWYLFDRTTEERVPFVDGMVVDANGSLVSTPPDINAILEQQDVSSKYGAPMGRRNQLDGTPDNLLYCQKVEFEDDCYDRGGAYWGSPSDLWCIFTDPDTTTDEYPIMVFVRGYCQEEAKCKARELLNDDLVGAWKFANDKYDH